MIDWDALLKFWAVVGPLLAAGISAVWSRRNAVQDRDFEQQRDNSRLSAESSLQDTQHKRSLKLENYKELKAALASYMTNTKDMVSRRSEHLTAPSPETKEVANLAYERWNHSFQLVALLGDQEITDMAINLWNAALAVPQSYNTASTPDYEVKIETFKNSGAAFLKKARALLGECRPE
jgi:hypothetical protein